MTDVSARLLTFLREAWIALAGAFLAFTLLAGIAQMLRVSSASVLGANMWVWESVSALLSIVVIGLFAFLGIPQIVNALQASIPGGGGCGPISELGTLASGLIGGLAALSIFIEQSLGENRIDADAARKFLDQQIHDSQVQ